MRKSIFVVMTTVAATAVVAVGTSAFAVAIAPPDVHGQVQDLPSIISGTWSPVEFDLTSAAGEPIVVAGPVAEPIGQQAKEESTTDPSDEMTAQGGTGGSDAEAPKNGPAQAPGGGSSPGGHGDKKDKEAQDKAAKEAKDKADKAKKEQEAKDKAAKEAKDKAEKEKKEKEAKDKAEKEKAK
jgi:hypothetical protein